MLSLIINRKEITMFSLFSIIRGEATYQRQRAAEIRRENLRWKLTIIFYALIACSLFYGIQSAWNADDAIVQCMKQGYSYDSCFQVLNR